MTVAASAPPSLSLKILRRDVDESIRAAQNSDVVAAPQAWSVAADAYVKLAAAELAAFNASPAKGLSYHLNLRDGIEKRGLLVTQGIQAAIGEIGESSDLAGKYTAASQALVAYESR
jgi:hypothetical protein